MSPGAGRSSIDAMPEAVTPEVAHHIATHREDAASAAGRREELVEICEAILLAVVAVATAWSGYQAALWDGRQSQLYGQASKERTAANRAATLGGQEELFDASLFTSWLEATARHDTATAQLMARRFRPEFRRAFVPWLRLDPLHNPDAPPTPRAMPQYRNANAARADSFEARAAVTFDAGTAAREHGDKYIRNTILLATVLFVAALAQRFKVLAIRVALVVVAARLLTVGLYFLATYPTL
jgi:hypothetical protein